MLKLAQVPEEQSEARQDTSGVTRGPRLEHRYYAFLSYSHKDQDVADWLHRELEAFHVPRALQGKLTGMGVIPKQLTPIFRDRHELAAADDLGHEIRAALASSQFLIVLCSPAAANSRWTNAEIEAFKRSRPEGCVLAAIVDGEPFASDVPGYENLECFPPALRHKYDRRGRPTHKRAEPLAADFRENADGKRLGFLKLVAGMLGLALDDLVQRENIRRQRRLAWLAAASLAGMAVTSTLAVTAIQARDAARDQRRQAEGLVEFMLGDLKDKLQPLGRLDILDSVGAKALAYYQKQDTSQLSDEALAQRSQALTLMGEVASTRGDLSAALGFYRAAFQGTAEALRRAPDDPQRTWDHAQNVFYLADIARSRGDLKAAEAGAREYKRLADAMIATDPSNPKWQMEGIYAENDLGALLNDQGRYSEAAAIFSNSLADRERLAAAYPANEKYRIAAIEALAWLGDAREKEGKLDDALAQRERQIAILQPIIARANIDVEYRRQAMVAYRVAGRLNALRGDMTTGANQLSTSIGIGEQLLQSEPSNTEWMSRAAGSKFDLARVDMGRNALDEAAALVRSGCDMTERLIAKDPTVLEWRVQLRGECLELTTRIALSRGAVAEAQDDSADMISKARAEVGKNKSEAAQLALSNAYVMRGIVAQTGGDSAGAASAFRNAAAAWPATAPDRPGLLARKVVILAGVGRSADAGNLAARLQRMGYGDRIYLNDARKLGVRAQEERE